LLHPGEDHFKLGSWDLHTEVASVNESQLGVGILPLLIVVLLRNHELSIIFQEIQLQSPALLSKVTEESHAVFTSYYLIVLQYSKVNDADQILVGGILKVDSDQFLLDCFCVVQGVDY